jgi:NADH-quinone oxidoreductase subunit C
MLNLKEKIEDFQDQRLIAIVCIHDNDMYLHYYFDDEGKINVAKFKVPEDRKVETLVDRYPAADYFEREVHDFFGIEFVGNLNLHLKLFLPDNWKGKPPLLKDEKNA